MAKRNEILRELQPHVTLCRDRVTGVAWVEDGRSGLGHSCHPNIDETGSPQGMVKRGYWKRSDRLAHSHGFIYNVERVVVTDELDKVAQEACRCVACAERL
jgi:hypothetical protein